MNTDMLMLPAAVAARTRGRQWFPIAHVRTPTPGETLAVAEQHAIRGDADDIGRRMARRGVRFAGMGLTYADAAPSLTGFTANANTSTETGLLVGPNRQPAVRPPFFESAARGLHFRGRGIFSTTGTPTLTFKFYLNTTVGPTNFAGTNVGVTAAITTGSGVSNKLFSFELDITCSTPAQGTTNATVYASGVIKSAAGFASPYEYAITPGTGDSATVTATLDGSLTQFFNMSATWSAQSSSNTITLEMLTGVAWN